MSITEGAHLPDRYSLCPQGCCSSCGACGQDWPCTGALRQAERAHAACVARWEALPAEVLYGTTMHGREAHLPGPPIRDTEDD